MNPTTVEYETENKESILSINQSVDLSKQEAKVSGHFELSRKILHYAHDGDNKICKELLEKYSFDIHAKDNSGYNVLHYAAKVGDMDFFQYLIERGSDVSATTRNGMSSFHVAAKNGHLNICTALLKNYNCDVKLETMTDGLFCTGLLKVVK